MRSELRRSMVIAAVGCALVLGPVCLPGPALAPAAQLAGTPVSAAVRPPAPAPARTKSAPPAPNLELVPGSPRGALWSAASDSVRKQLPRSAIVILDSIHAGALRDHAYPEAIKALATRIVLESARQEDEAAQRVKQLQAAMTTSPAPMQPVLEAILAHWYWEYFQQNRWRFRSRTPAAAEPGAELQTWDLPRILGTIDAHFSAALARERELQAIPVATYGILLTTGTAPDACRPTMFDFLAHEALRFYTAGEQGAAAPEDAFELEARGPIFAPAEQFLRWQPRTTDDASPQLKAVRLYQQLLAFHQHDADRRAWSDADLERLVFGKNVAVGETKDARYVDALERFCHTWERSEIASRARAEWATVLRQAGLLVKARRVAQRGVEAFPNSAGGTRCLDIVQEIEQGSASIATESVWSEPPPSIDVTYRNVTRVYFRAVPYGFSAYLRRQWQPGVDGSDAQRGLLARTPVRMWHADLPPTADYQEHTVKLPAPTEMDPGFYVIVASCDSAFREAKGGISVASVWVTNLALVVRTGRVDGCIDGFVLRASDGEPVAGATVQAWVQRFTGDFDPAEQTTTDSNGCFRLPGRRRSILLLAQYGEQRVVAGNFEASSREPAPSGTRTVFFTDRALYRPGQTIAYKGIRYRFDAATSTYHVLGGQRVDVTIQDTNGQLLERVTLQSNDYGSFSGSFAAPRGRLTGSLRISTDSGSTTVAVEEYKRPKFQVELRAPKEAATLDAQVVVPGTATAYTGAPIGGATVHWQVKREVRFPLWCWWSRNSARWPRGGAQEIAHGTSVTQPDGSFSVRFVAVPDRRVARRDEPTFVYRVLADVTDATGEARNDTRTVRAAYTAVEMALEANAWQTPAAPVELHIAATSLNGAPQVVRGTVRVCRLRQPERAARAPLGDFASPWGRGAASAEPAPVASDPETWAVERVVRELRFTTDAAGEARVAVPLPVGIYRALLATTDRFGKPVQARLQLLVVDPDADRFPIKIAECWQAPRWSCEPGERFTALWGTGYDHGRAFVEIEQDGKPLSSYWTAADRTQQVIAQDVQESMRGGFTVRVTSVRENRAYLHEQVVDVPWSNKQLTVRWEHFRSKLTPGEQETWSLRITGPDSAAAVAEMAAALYDASLDQFRPHAWNGAFAGFRHEEPHVQSEFTNASCRFEPSLGPWWRERHAGEWRYRSFDVDILARHGWMPLVSRGRGVALTQNAKATDVIASDVMHMTTDKEILSLPVESVVEAVALNSGAVVQGGELHVRGGRSDERAAPLDAVQVRKDLAETAFFFPQLLCDAQGQVTLQFKVPEALTEWKFLGFAHDRELRSGALTASAVTAKELMVEPNPPRFVREGDVIEFTAKVSNQSAARQTGRVKLTLADAQTSAPVDQAVGNVVPEIDFDVPAHAARTYAWRLAIPDGCSFLTYKVVGASATSSDGEEGFLPVLSRRILVTESLPLPLRGKQTKQFEFAKLLAAAGSPTLLHQSLTVQMVSQPAWYAVMALPYLMEFPYECSEQVFNRLYANQLGHFIVASDSRIRTVFERWRGTPALDSPLEKNDDLKAVLLEETPWVRQAQDESRARRNVGLLFDANRLDDESRRAMRKLVEMQARDGRWPWFPGGRPNEYLTLYITTGFGRLRHLGVPVEMALALRSLTALDAWMDAEYEAILRQGTRGDDHLNSLVALYLYGRSFFLQERPVAPVHEVAFAYWIDQARTYWPNLRARQSQAHVALGLLRAGDTATPRAIVKSLAERSLQDEELGMHWRDQESSWWWHAAPIETQAMMIEAFAEVTADTAAVEACQVWLLKQKQTQAWSTTRATADAVYALLLRGTTMLASDALVQVALAGKTIAPENVEAGTGFYEQRFTRGEIQPAMGHVTVTKSDPGVSWGSIHWQHLEDMAKVTPHEGTPLQLKKALFVKRPSKSGPVLEPVTGSLAVGDELVTRIELRCDRDMEFVHLYDQRGSGTEPADVMSQYRYQDGLLYYQSTRDTASHFFIDYLRHGVYVFEYSVRVQLRGNYQTGMAAIECMYAPEFNSHSGTYALEVR